MVTKNEPNIYETGVLDSNAEGNFVYTTLDAAINWIRKNSLWPMPMGLSCCAIEFMAVACSRYDLSRFGSEVTRFSPRQADVMIVAGTVTYKMALAVRRRKTDHARADPAGELAAGLDGVEGLAGEGRQGGKGEGRGGGQQAEGWGHDGQG